MDCPHCGGPIDTAAPRPLEHPCFDDRRRQICVREERRNCRPLPWRALLIMRQRFGHFVPLDFLAQWAARNPAEGGNVEALRVHIARLRPLLEGSPFAIASAYGWGYGLFPRAEIAAIARRDGRRDFRATAGPAPLSIGQWLAGEQPPEAGLERPRWPGRYGPDGD